MKLTGSQVEELHTALLKAFPQYASLELFVRTKLEKNLAEIAGESNLSAVVYDLIKWVESQGRIEEFIQKAYDANSSNPDLRNFVLQSGLVTETLATGRLQFPGSIAIFINELQDPQTFRFRWEPRTYGSGLKPIVYWPVRLRHPTIIHAAQCFAAAGLMRLGAEVNLWLDDLGNCSYSDIQFCEAVERWFTKVGVADLAKSNFRVDTFSSVLGNNEQTPWPIVHKWLGSSGYKMEQVLRISKLWPNNNTAEQLLDHLEKGRPRRLLTPTLVWTCLNILHNKDTARPLMTLGGYDEQLLWKTWTELGISSAHVGNLYIPELLEAPSNQASNAQSRPIHMGETDIKLEWVSREDIQKALERELYFCNNDDCLDPSRMIAWCLQNCVLLPAWINGEKRELQVGGKSVASTENIAPLDKKQLINALAKSLEYWLL